MILKLYFWTNPSCPWHADLPLSYAYGGWVGANCMQWQWNRALVGVCFAGVQRLQQQRQEPPEMLYLTWMGMAAKIQQRNEVVNRQCVELQAKLSADGIRSCIFKVLRFLWAGWHHGEIVNGYAPFSQPILIRFSAQKWVDWTALSGWVCSVFATLTA